MIQSVLSCSTAHTSKYGIIWKLKMKLTVRAITGHQHINIQSIICTHFTLYIVRYNGGVVKILHTLVFYYEGSSFAHY